MIDKNLFVQTFAGVITIVLLITFYILLITDLIRGTQTFITAMVNIIIAIVLVSMFSILYNIEIKMTGQMDQKTIRNTAKKKNA